MKKYLIKVVFILVAIVAITTVVKHTVPFYYGNYQISNKYDFFKQDPEINSVFVGNSLLNRHVNPTIFDHFTKTTKSFNLSADATNFFERSYLVENFIQKLDVQNIFLLVSASAPIRSENLYTTRLCYYHDFRRFVMASNKNSRNFDQLYVHAVSYLQNLMSLNGRLSYYFSNANNYKEIDGIIYNNRGFISYNDEARLTGSKYDSLEQRQVVESIIPLKKLVLYNQENVLDQEEIIMLNECKRLLNLAVQKQKNLFFIFLPNDQNFAHFSLSNTLYMGSGEDFPEFYDVDNYFNVSHLNGKGASHFSKRLATVYLENALANQN